MLRRIVLFAITLLVGAACVGLGFWQLGRLSERRAYNAGAEAARSLPPLEPAGGASLGLEPNRRVTISGVYDEARELRLRNRVVRGVPAVAIVTPLRIAGRDTAVLVNRGYVPAADASDPGDRTWSEPGERRVTGLALPVPDRGDGAPVAREGRGETWQALDLTAVRGRLPYPVHDLYLIAELDSGSTAHTADGGIYPIRAEPPALGDGPHLSYAIQWFGIATAVVAFGVMFGLRRRKAAGPEI